MSVVAGFWRWGLAGLGLGLGLVGCGSGEGAYPPIVDNFADIRTDGGGQMVSLSLDDGDSFSITNRLEVSSYRPDTVYRVVAGYTLEGKAATLYRLSPVAVLGDSTGCARHDPVGVVGVWLGGGYVNLHLVAMTHHSRPHFVGFACDSVAVAGEGRVHSTTHISLHHDQNGDPVSFSANAYCSIRRDGIGVWRCAGDTLCIRVCTFDGDRVWRFVR